MAKNKDTGNEAMPISVGRTYVRKNGGEEVVPFLVEMSGLVAFAPVGSSREDRMDAGMFMDTFDLKEIDDTAAKDAPSPAITEPGAAEPTMDSKPIRTEDQRKALEESQKAGE